MKKHVLIIILISAFSANLVFSEGEKDNNPRKINGKPDFTFFDINNISTFIYNDGGTDFNLLQGSGFEYPKGSRKALVFSSGLVWGAKYNGQVRVGGSTFKQGLVGGKILPDGSAENFNADNVRIYRVRRDFADLNNRENVDVSAEINDQQGSAKQIRDQYIKDWNEWPANDGAPFEDINNDGFYNADIDIPGIPGADQTIWYVANDLDSYFTFELYGSPPLGIEMQATFWGYSNNTPADNIMFRRYVIINKSNVPFEDMYLSLWMDPDIGDAGDDLVGCDTISNLGYAYNSSYFDATYGNEAPAIGFKILQGPKTPASPDESAKFFGNKINGMKNIEMTSFHYLFKCCPPNYGDPVYGVYDLGSLNWYEYMKGNLRTGDKFLVPERFGGGSSTFPYSGNPVAGTGWIDGIDIEPSDRRMGIGTGPFTMAPGDTQEVIYAHIAAGGTNGVNSITAVSLIKQYSDYAQLLYDSDFITGLEISNPNVQVYEMDKAIGLAWGSNADLINKVETFEKKGYKFQGYNVYQFSYPAEETKNAIRIATFDIIDGITQILDADGNVEQFGSDSGILRNIIINRDYINDTELVNGKEYYFGVASYTYNSEIISGFKSTESFPEIFSIRPRGYSPGFSSPIKVSENLNIEHTFGSGNALLNAAVISPEKLSGNSYIINFNSSNDNSLEIIITNENTNEQVFSGMFIKIEQSENITFDGVSLEINNKSNGSDSFNYLSDDDIYKFSTTAVSFDKNKAVVDSDEINIFPNPYYYKVESTGLLKYPDYVTISHLPQNAVIKIFNLNGQLMNSINKNTNNQFITWDLFTKWGRRIPPGLYIIYIDMPDIGASKILKLAVI